LLTLSDVDVVVALTQFAKDADALTNTLERGPCRYIEYRDPANREDSTSESHLFSTAVRDGAASGAALQFDFFIHGSQCAPGEYYCPWQKSNQFMLTHTLGSATVTGDGSVETIVETQEHVIRHHLADGELLLIKVVKRHTRLYVPGDSNELASESQTVDTVYNRTVTVKDIHQFFAEMLAIVHGHIPYD
jgi:hypothetical protein